MLNVINNWRLERSAVAQLSRLSDRDLADLGIERRDIKTVARLASAKTIQDAAADVETPIVFAAVGSSLHVEPANVLYRPTSLAA